ncbi:hypothetical protein EUX98_g8332 [Antrodiella citrinella]|uniref:Uncharacterized protein n=1 Tax=Antrodiella citrinella TaxID=2447956 RepID=A0A4S4MAN9_9APHY|nr:hypothetical protein EUX98_g8332 [Antrodiella citrinella]
MSSRKCFVVSLAENEQSKTLINERKQIAFVLTPTELDPGYELHKTVHPVIWAVYDCSFGQPQTLDWDLNLGVATVRKEPDGSVVTPLTRVVPVGHYTSLTRSHQRLEWCDVARLREDMPTTIIVNNDSGLEQAFAICLAMVEKFQDLPKFAPIVLFNRIPSYIKVKGSFNVQAYCGTNIKERQQVHADKLEQIKDEHGNPWSISLDDLSKVTSLHVSKSGSGQICISTQENEVGQLKAKLKDFQYQVTRALGTDYLAVSRLKTDILNITHQMDSVKEDVDKTTGRVDKVIDRVNEMEIKVSECVEAIALLRTPESMKKILALRIGEVASAVQDMSRLHSSIKTMEENMHGLGNSLQGLPNLRSDVCQLAGQVQQLSQEMSSVDTRFSNINKRVLGVTQKVGTNEENLASVERSVADMRRTIVDAGNDVKQAPKSVKDVITALQKKADTSDLIKVQIDTQSITSRVTQLEEGAVDIRDKLGEMSGRIEEVDGGLNVVKETVEGLTEKAQTMTNNHSRNIGELTQRAQRSEEGIQQLNVAYQRGEAASTKDRAELRALHNNLEGVSSTATEACSKAARLQGEFDLFKMAKLGLEEVRDSEPASASAGPNTISGAALSRIHNLTSGSTMKLALDFANYCISSAFTSLLELKYSKDHSSFLRLASTVSGPKTWEIVIKLDADGSVNSYA